MLKSLVILLLSLGFFPVVIDNSRLQFDAIKADMQLLGLRNKDISRSLGISESWVGKCLRGVPITNKYFPVIKTFIANKKAEMLKRVQHDKGKNA